MTKDNNINYGALIDEAMQIIVKKSLIFAIDQSLPGEHHFYISFLTRHKGVSLSPKLLAQYPKEMTIILQYQFDNLIVNDKGFSVTLSFNNTPEEIVVPFDALTAFADPSVKFGLQFRKFSEKVTEEEISDENTTRGSTIRSFTQPNLDNIEKIVTKKRKTPSKIVDKITKNNIDDSNISPTETASNVVTLDSFRKKNKKNKD